MLLPKPIFHWFACLIKDKKFTKEIDKIKICSFILDNLAAMALYKSAEMRSFYPFKVTVR